MQSKKKVEKKRQQKKHLKMVNMHDFSCFSDCTHPKILHKLRQTLHGDYCNKLSDC